MPARSCRSYTHLQRAQSNLGHHLMAYAEMFIRDIGRR